MNAKSLGSPRPVVVSNIPNDKSQTLADSYESRGNAHQQAGRFREARQFYEKWFQLKPSFESACRLGDVCRQVEDFKVALRWYKKGEEFSLRHGTSREWTDAQLGKAMCIRGLGKYQQALSLLKKCLSAYKKSKDIEGEAYVLWALGTTHRFACQFAQAEKQLRLSVEKYSLLKDPSGLAYARAGLGGTLRMRGKPQESFHLYQKASQFFSQAKDHFGIAYSSCGQGNALRMMGFSDKALPYMNKAIRIYKALRLRGPLGFVLWSRSQAFLALKKRDQAQRDLQEARRQFLLVKDRRGLKYCVLGHRQLQKKPCKIIQIP